MTKIKKKIHAISLFWSRQAIKMRESCAQAGTDMANDNNCIYFKYLVGILDKLWQKFRVHIELKGYKRANACGGGMKERKTWERVDWLIGRREAKQGENRENKKTQNRKWNNKKRKIKKGEKKKQEEKKRERERKETKETKIEQGSIAKSISFIT